MVQFWSVVFAWKIFPKSCFRTSNSTLDAECSLLLLLSGWGVWDQSCRWWWFNLRWIVIWPFYLKMCCLSFFSLFLSIFWRDRSLGTVLRYLFSQTRILCSGGSCWMALELTWQQLMVWVSCIFLPVQNELKSAREDKKQLWNSQVKISIIQILKCWFICLEYWCYWHNSSH